MLKLTAADLAPDPLASARLKGRIARLRDRSVPAHERALTATLLSAELRSGVPGYSHGGAAMKDDPSQRMFEYGVLHPAAAPWDGRSMRSGTITYVAVDGIEQYVGPRTWIAYSPDALERFSPEVGDQLRIARSGDGVEVQRIGPNRLERAAGAYEACSGMTLFFAAALERDSLEETAHSVAQRYSADVTVAAETFTLELAEGTRLDLRALDVHATPGLLDAARVLAVPPLAAVRLEVVVRSNKPESALAAERALTLTATLLTSETLAAAFDDSGAIFSQTELHRLAVRNETRGDSFEFAAAAARRLRAAPIERLSYDRDACDELIVFGALAWRADFALSFLRSALEEMAEGAEHSEDPVMPLDGAFCADEERGEPGTLQPLLRLFYERAEVEIAFLDVPAADGAIASSVAGRKDVAAALGGPIRSAVVFSIVARGGDIESAQFGLERSRADVLVTALASLCSRRCASISTDAGGTLYDLDQLLDAALHRRGCGSSWRARAAAALCAG